MFQYSTVVNGCCYQIRKLVDFLIQHSHCIIALEPLLSSLGTLLAPVQRVVIDLCRRIGVFSL